ncbi:MAG TPA: hypothetical protein VIH90_00050 [Candidatus Saccharimonadales bacterium]
MKLRFYASFLLLLATLPANAQSNSVPRAKIEKILGAYANTVGCDFEMDRKNIVKTYISEDFEKVFVALFINDNVCAGGSGSWKSYLAVLWQHNEYPDKGGLYVLPELTMPVISSIGLPRFIDRVFIKDGKLWFSGRIHAPMDANNFPTIHVQAQVQLLKTEAQIDAKNKSTIYYWKSTTDYQDQ